MRLPILCYHQVGPEAELGRRLNVSPERLTSHIRFFKRRGFRFVQAGSLASTWLPRSVCFTFDDAYVSTLTYGLDVLLREQATASIYAVPSKVGGSSDWAGETPKPLADWDLLLAAQSKGIEIGNHTFSHARMSEITGEEQAREWALATTLLEQHGLDVRSACWPYGLVGDLSALDVSVGLALGGGWAVEPSSGASTPGEWRRQNAALTPNPSPRGGGDRKKLPRQAIAFGDNLAGLLYRLYVRPFLP